MKLFFAQLLNSKATRMVGLVACLLSAPSQAASQSELAAISVIGQVNAVALQCRYVEEVQRIKRVLVQTLPKQRSLGVWFEQTTNDAFMEFMRQEKSCPPHDEFSSRLDQAIDGLKKVYE